MSTRHEMMNHFDLNLPQHLQKNRICLDQLQPKPDSCCGIDGR